MRRDFALVARAFYCVLGTMLPDGCPVVGEGIPVVGEELKGDAVPVAPGVPVVPGVPGPPGLASGLPAGLPIWPTNACGL